MTGLSLIKISEVAQQYNISTRTLRYYEQAGILWSSHSGPKAPRCYDPAALERLKQIMVLRKMQIPIKDIELIYKSENMQTMIQAFVDKLDTLDHEITALSELRRVVDDFLQKMITRGITRISAITLLYEETEKRLFPSVAEGAEAVSFEALTRISREALKLHEVRILRLPSKRMLTSCLHAGGLVSLDLESMQNLFAEYGIIPTPGLRNCFYQKRPDEEWIMLAEISEDFDNKTPYQELDFPGGLYAAASSFMEDMDETFVLLREWIERSDCFELDIDGQGSLQRSEMIEEILPWDIAVMLNRYQQDVFVPVRIKNRKDEVNG